MNINIEICKDEKAKEWNQYVFNHSQATLYHLAEWQKIIKETYGHKTYYLIALKSMSDDKNEWNAKNNKIVGILPLVHLKHFIFGNSIISIPFFDMGGMLTNNQEIEIALLKKSIDLAASLGAENIEIRNAYSINYNNNNLGSKNDSVISTYKGKARMILNLPESPSKMMKSFKSKLRSQIKKPIKEGLNSQIGGKELLDDFYKVFSINMRDLGSPVHSKKMFANVIKYFSRDARIIIVYKDKKPLACSIIIGFKDILENPWASALRQYSRLSPNMLLYWTMIEYAINNGFKQFDFGRSTPGEGTYKFKEQWGTKPEDLNWLYIALNHRKVHSADEKKSKFDNAIKIWQNVPVSVSKIIGPAIRKHIGL